MATQLFVCDCCNCVDTSNRHDWAGDWLCSECDDRIGEWHHLFIKEPYHPSRHPQVMNRSNPNVDEDGNEICFG